MNDNAIWSEIESPAFLRSPAPGIEVGDWAFEVLPAYGELRLGVRVLGIFGPTDPRLFGPYPPDAPTNVVVQAPVGDLKLLSAKEVYARFQRVRARFK